MSHATLRRLGVVAASAVLLSGVTAATGSAAFAAGRHVPGHARHMSARTTLAAIWDRGVDKKKDHWDSRTHSWQRWDAESHSYARWDDRNHMWQRTHSGHAQRWDAQHGHWK